MSHLHGVITNVESNTSQLESSMSFLELEQLISHLLTEMEYHFAKDFQDKAAYAKNTAAKIAENARQVMELYEAVRKLKVDMLELTKQLEEDNQVVREASGSIQKLCCSYLNAVNQFGNSKRNYLAELCLTTIVKMDELRDYHQRLVDLHNIERDDLLQILDYQERTLRASDKNITRLHELSEAVQIGLDKATQTVITQGRHY